MASSTCGGATMLLVAFSRRMCCSGFAEVRRDAGHQAESPASIGRAALVFIIQAAGRRRADQCGPKGATKTLGGAPPRCLRRIRRGL